MAKQFYENNVTVFLDSGIDSAATTITVNDSSRIPNVTGGDAVPLTLIDKVGDVETAWEIVHVTGKSGNILTVVRGQDGTSARAWTVSTPAQIRVTNGLLSKLRDDPLRIENNLSDITNDAAARANIDVYSTIEVDQAVDQVRIDLNSSDPSKGAALVKGAVKYVDAITTIDATGLPDGISIVAKGRSVAGDGGGGLFRYSSSSMQTTDSGTVFAPAAGSGRLFRDGWTVFGFNGHLNARWFGAKGDGTTDDIAALNSITSAAAPFATGIEINTGTYVTSSTWAITRAMDVIADGATIKPTSALSGPCIRYGVDGSTPRPSGTKSNTVRGLELDGSNTTNPAAHGIDMWCSHTEFCHNSIHNFAGHGLYATQAWSNLVHHNFIYDNALSGVYLENACNAFSVINNYIIGNDNYGVFVSGCNGVVIARNDIEQNTRNAIRVIGIVAHATRRVSICHNYLELNATDGGYPDDIYVDRAGNEINGLEISYNYHETPKNINITSVNSATVRSNTHATLVLGDEGYNVFTEDQTMGNYDATVSNAFKGTYTSHNATDGFLIEGRLVGFALRRKSVGTSVDAFYVRNPGNTDRANAYLNGPFQFGAVAAADVPNNSLYRSSADNKLYFKDNAGVSNALY